MHFFLWRLNVLFTSSHAHMRTFDLGQNSWPIWPRGILVQNWYEFIFVLFFSKEFYVSFLDILMCYLQVFMHTCRHLILVKILYQSDLVAFWCKVGTSWYKIGTSFFFFFIKEFCISFLEVLMCYVQVFMHTREHLI